MSAAGNLVKPSLKASPGPNLGVAENKKDASTAEAEEKKEEEPRPATPALYVAYNQAKNVYGALFALKQKQSIKNGNVDILYKTVRELYEKPPKQPVSHDKIVRRTTETFITDVTDDHWDVKRARQKKALQEGHYTEHWEPYRPLGELVLEPYELVWSTLGDSLPSHFVEDIRATAPKNTAHLKLPNDHKHEASIESICDLEERRRYCQSAGMKDIKALLQETESRLVACRAGQPFVKHVRDCQEEKAAQKRLENEALSAGNTMVLQEVTGDGMDIQMQAVGGLRRRTITRGDRLFFIKPASQFLKLSSNIKCRKKKAFAEKIGDIYLVLCYLVNMRSRHLKSKTSLSADILKALRRDPYAPKEGPGNSNSHPVSKRPNSKGSRATITSNPPGTAGSSADHSRLPGSSHGSGIGVREKGSLLSNYLKTRGMNRRRTIKIGEIMDDSTKLETWDDLVNLGTKKNILKLLKKIPPWQQTYHNYDSSTALMRRKQEDKEHSDLHHAEEAVNRFKLSLTHMKEKLQNNNSVAMDIIEKEQLVKGRHKLAAFDNMHPLFELHKETLNKVSAQAHYDPTIVSEKTADWYENLLSEAANLSTLDNPTVDIVLTKLENFMKDDIRKISNAKEKMALIVMSMPVYEICIPSMISALQFVLEEVLRTNKSLLRHWLNVRHLPIIR